jgi:hypothetical protein
MRLRFAWAVKTDEVLQDDKFSMAGVRLVKVAA